eukprot:SAG22_NODE_198_length_15480_cov_24.005526_10_plen_73_part_00
MFPVSAFPCESTVVLTAFRNMANASARDYFVKNLIEPLAVAPMIDGVFFDAFNCKCDTFSISPLPVSWPTRC